MRKKNKKHNRARIVLRLPDLDHSKTSVLNSLSSPRSRRNYRFAMDQFIAWYCFEPRLALNRTVVLRSACISSHSGWPQPPSIKDWQRCGDSPTKQQIRSLGPGVSCRHTTCEGRQAIGAKIWKLAKFGTVPRVTGEV